MEYTLNHTNTSNTDKYYFCITKTGTYKTSTNNHSYIDSVYSAFGSENVVYCSPNIASGSSTRNGTQTLIAGQQYWVFTVLIWLGSAHQVQWGRYPGLNATMNLKSDYSFVAETGKTYTVKVDDGYYFELNGTRLS